MSEEATVEAASQEDILGENKREVKKEVCTLRHKFSSDEKMDLTDQLCDKLAEIDQIEKAKKEANDEFKSQTSSVDAQISRLRQQLTSGFEERPIDCEVHFHVPATGKKTIFRMDTMEKVEVQQMSPMECQDRLPLSQEEEEDVKEELEEEVESDAGAPENDDGSGPQPSDD